MTRFLAFVMMVVVGTTATAQFQSSNSTQCKNGQCQIKQTQTYKLMPSCQSKDCPKGECKDCKCKTTSALDEVNSARARRGLRPFKHDSKLEEAAKKAAEFRARRRIFGHVMGGRGDFQFLDTGVHADSAGCAAYPAHMGWLSCCTYENYNYAGAAYVVGDDGRRYMHLFVRR